MVDQGVSFGKIAENLNATLEEKALQPEIFVEKLNSKESERQEKSWVERMRSDPTKGRSAGGSYEL